MYTRLTDADGKIFVAGETSDFNGATEFTDVRMPYSYTVAQNDEN